MSKVMPSPRAAEATPEARRATTPTTPHTPATAATTRDRVVAGVFDAFADAGVEPYPASVEVGIRDVREFIVFVALVTSVTKEPLEGEGRSNA